MNGKQQTPFERNIVNLAVLLNQTDHAARKALAQREDGTADLSELKNCVDQLNKYMAERKWENDYVRLKGSIAQGERAVDTVCEALEKKKSDTDSQYVLLNALKEKIGTDPSNHDLIERIEQLERTIAGDRDKTGEILVLEKELEKLAQLRRERLRQANELKSLVDYLLIMALYEQRLGLWALANPNTVLWTRLAQEWKSPAVLERERSSIFDLLGKQALLPGARKIHDCLQTAMSETEGETHDFSVREERREAKQQTLAELKKIAKLEELCREAFHEDSEQYKELMEAQNALLADSAEETSLKEMQGRLQTLQKTSRKYMESRVEKGNISGMPRREARLVYAAALNCFALKYGQQLSEAMRCRDIESLELPDAVTKEYVKNSLAAVNRMVREQFGVDPAKENAAELEKSLTLKNNRQ